MGPNRSPSPRRRRTLWAAALAPILFALVVAAPASANFITPQHGGSPNADSINTLYIFVLVVAIIVFVGVEGALIYAMVKFKARKGAVAKQTRGNTNLEIGWTAGAAVILVILAVFTFIKLPSIRDPDNSSPVSNQDYGGQQQLASSGVANGVLVAAGPSKKLPPNGKSLNIRVNGQQYLWRYTYPDGDGNDLNNPFAYYQMVVPTDTAVTLDIVSQDVNHSWWIPDLGGKFDAVPGYVNHTWFKIPSKYAGKTFAAGHVFKGQCAELCGRNHANMIAEVKAVSPEQFEAWLKQQKAQIAQAEQSAAVQRQKLQASESNPPQQ